MQDEQQKTENEKTLVRVKTFPSDMDAELAQATLKAAGIDSIIMKDGADGMLQVLEYVEGVRLLVDEDKVEEATTILEETASATPDETKP